MFTDRFGGEVHVQVHGEGILINRIERKSKHFCENTEWRFAGFSELVMSFRLCVSGRDVDRFVIAAQRVGPRESFLLLLAIFPTW